MSKLANIARNSLRRHNFAVMAGKVVLRLKERREDAHEWCRSRAEPYEAFLRDVDADLWDETAATTATMRVEGERRLAALGLDMGGGGNYDLLYFMTRKLKPEVVVETGVAAGWSSQAILMALRANGASGRLYSSDFPYFRFENPESLIGCVVSDELRRDWRLFIDGDRANLRRILGEVPRIDLFHYDSDKSRAGRDFALRVVNSHLSPQAVVIFDDIQDNFHFRDLVASTGQPFKVFEFEGKFVGLTGALPGSRAARP